jgi:transaldolase
MNLLRNIKIFADGAVTRQVPELIEKFAISGFTTNPTLMAKEGIRDYRAFAKELLAVVGGRPVSFEVFADDVEDMRRQALTLADWGENVYVKIPITNTRRESTAELVKSLSHAGVKLNVTAVFTPEQIAGLARCFDDGTPAVVSIFAGRIADAGIDPSSIIRGALSQFQSQPHVEVLWASVREIYNVVHAADVGCHIVTVPINMLDKLRSLGKDLAEFSLDTVKMFRADALASGLSL